MVSTVLAVTAPPAHAWPLQRRGPSSLREPFGALTKLPASWQINGILIVLKNFFNHVNFFFL